MCILKLYASLLLNYNNNNIIVIQYYIIIRSRFHKNDKVNI